MADRLYTGRGSGGVDDEGQLAEDLRALSDPARRARRVESTRQPAVEANAEANLDAAFSEGGDGEIRSLNDRIVDGLVNKQRQLKDLDPVADRDKYMAALTDQIKLMHKRAKDVDASGTGNVAAKNTYLQVASTLIDRLRRMQDEEVGGAASQPATQPVASQPTTMR